MSNEIKFRCIYCEIYWLDYSRESQEQMIRHIVTEHKSQAMTDYIEDTIKTRVKEEIERHKMNVLK